MCLSYLSVRKDGREWHEQDRPLPWNDLADGSRRSGGDDGGQEPPRRQAGIRSLPARHRRRPHEERFISAALASTSTSGTDTGGQSRHVPVTRSTISHRSRLTCSGSNSLTSRSSTFVLMLFVTLLYSLFPSGTLQYRRDELHPPFYVLADVAVRHR